MGLYDHEPNVQPLLSITVALLALLHYAALHCTSLPTHEQMHQPASDVCTLMLQSSLEEGRIIIGPTTAAFFTLACA